MPKLLLLMLMLSSIAQARFPRGVLAARDCLSTYSLIKDYPPDSFEFFRALYSQANPKSLGANLEQDNVHFMSLMKGPDAAKLVFVHGMLKPLKRLNDAVFAEANGTGKDEVNAARNLFRIFLAENLEAHPELSKALVGRFMDFKTVELAFDPSKMKVPSTFQAELDHVIRTSQIHFDEAMTIFLRKNPALRETILQERGLAGDFRGWHLFGVATGNADYAVAAARQAVRFYDKERGPRLNANWFKPGSLDEAIGEVESTIKPRLLASLAPSSGVFMKYEGTSHDVLSPDAIDVLRKVNAAGQPEYIAAVKADFAVRFNGLELTDRQVLDLRDYFAMADDFQPTVRKAKREQIDTTGARDGLMNVDYASQNVVNMYHTMGAIAEGGVALGRKDSNVGGFTVDRARAGEIKATARLTELQLTLDAARAKAGILGDYHVSGDDGSVVLKGIPTPATRQSFYRELLKGKPPASDYRIVWVPPLRNKRAELDTGAMGQESLKGENFEKKLRAKLYGKLPMADLKSVGISLDLDPTAKSYRLIFFGPKGNAETVAAKAQAAIAELKLAPEGYRLDAVQVIW